jgi:flagellar biosynthetic protein FliQ
MTLEMVMDLSYRMMATAFEIILPVLALSMSIGIAVAIFQAATQIQEASLSFVPKLFGMGLAILLFGSYILQKLVSYTVTLINSLPSVSG